LVECLQKYLTVYARQLFGCGVTRRCNHEASAWRVLTQARDGASRSLEAFRSLRVLFWGAVPIEQRVVDDAEPGRHAVVIAR
jgi:hypothetical protein